MSEVNKKINTPYNSIVDFSVYDESSFGLLMDRAFIMNRKINFTVERIKNSSEYSQKNFIEWEAIKIILKKEYMDVQNYKKEILATDIESLGVLKYEFGNFGRGEVNAIVSFISKKADEKLIDKLFYNLQKMKMGS